MKQSTQMEKRCNQYGDLPDGRHITELEDSDLNACELKFKREALIESGDIPESARQILRCAPPFDAQAEHEADLEYESRVDSESWNHDEHQ